MVNKDLQKSEIGPAQNGHRSAIVDMDASLDDGAVTSDDGRMDRC